MARIIEGIRAPIACRYYAVTVQIKEVDTRGESSEETRNIGVAQLANQDFPAERQENVHFVHRLGSVNANLLFVAHSPRNRKCSDMTADHGPQNANKLPRGAEKPKNSCKPLLSRHPHTTL